MAEIGIVVPVYNAEKYLSDAVESVIAQTFSDWQLILIDDGSKDTSLEIASRFAANDPRIRVDKQPNSGPGKARNRGLMYLDPDTKYVLFLDADDYLETTALETLHNALEAALSASAAYGLARPVAHDGTPLLNNINESNGYERYMIRGKRYAHVGADEPTTFNALVVFCFIPTPGQVLIRNSVLRTTGSFDPAITYAEDWDLWLHASLLGEFIRVNTFTINKREHSTNVTKASKTMAEAEQIVRRKLATSTSLSSLQRDIARRGHLYSCYYKLSWAVPHLRQRHFKEAIRAVGRAGYNYYKYLRTSYT